MNYKGYELSVVQIHGKWDGKAEFPEMPHRTIVTVVHHTKADAINTLKGSIDYWMQPITDANTKTLREVLKLELEDEEGFGETN